VVSIKLDSVYRRGQTRPVLDRVSLHIDDGELIVLVGASGAGKTALLRAIAGLDPLDGGSIHFGPTDVTEVPVASRDVSLVFQDSALFPTFTARENVGYPLVLRRTHHDEVNRRVEAEARALDIEQVLERWPRQLADGHQQLVEIARALVRVPTVLLLDEPMSKLDPPTRERLRIDLKELQRGYGVTTVYATNDPREAMGLADRIVAIDEGRIVQVDIPDVVYRAPADLDVAWLTGPMGVLDAQVSNAEGGGVWLAGAGFRLRVRAPALASMVGDRVRVGVRPEAVVVDHSSQIIADVQMERFEAGGPMALIRIGTASVATTAVVPEGTSVPVRFARFLVFGPDGRRMALVE